MVISEVGGQHRRQDEWDVQTTGCKIGSSMYCTTQEIQSIFYNSYK